MKRFHIHLSVKSLEPSILFYSKLFGVEPTMRKPDYAKWMLDDPRINFAISTQSGSYGLNHLGLQLDSPAELEDIRKKLQQAELRVFGEGKTVCCYAHSDKSWVKDPDGIAWETYHTMQAAELFRTKSSTTKSVCCKPADNAKQSACAPSCC